MCRVGAENGFCILYVKALGRRNPITVVGHAASISAGEWITVTGEGVNDRTYRSQLRAHFLRTFAPTTAPGPDKHLASGMIRGIGPKLREAPGACLRHRKRLPSAALRHGAVIV